MFESKEKLASEIEELLEALRCASDSRYACLLDTKGMLFEAPEEPASGTWPIRKLLRDRGARLFEIPGAMEHETPIEDHFAGFDEDDFFLAFINNRVAIVIACPDAEPLQRELMRPLKALADRLLRYNETYRLDDKGGGLFFGTPKLDMVVVGRADG